MTYYFINIALSFIGACIAGYIYYTKHKKQPLVCPMRGHCDAVVHSKYSKVMGVPVEIAGFLYYAGLFAAYIYADFTTVMPETVRIVLLAISLSGFLFSLYLTTLQLFVIRQICTWCFISASLTTVIFIVSLLSYVNM